MPIRWQLITNFPFARRAKALADLPVFERDKVRELATEIFQRYLSRGSLPIKLQMFVDLCYTINDVTHVGHDREGRPPYTANRLTQGIGELLAASVSQESDVKNRVDALVGQTEQGGEVETWFYSKVKTFSLHLDEAIQVERFLAQMLMQERSDSRLHALIETYGSRAGQLAANLIRELRQLRKYGVKTSFFQDGLLHAPSQAWVFLDPDELRQQLPSWLEIPQQLAIISLSDRASLTKISVESLGTKQVGKSQLVGAVLRLGAHVGVNMDLEGEFDATHTGLGLMPVRAFFARRRSEHLYEIFRLVQALRLYDLVVPVARVARMPSLAPATTFERAKEIFVPNKIRDLVIPRLRSFDDIERIIGELKIEVEKADEETVRRMRQESERHEVTHHIRRLPKGKCATPEARARAEALGFALGDHETFVKAHLRGVGELNESPHRARQRKVPN